MTPKTTFIASLIGTVVVALCCLINNGYIK